MLSGGTCTDPVQQGSRVNYSHMNRSLGAVATKLDSHGVTVEQLSKVVTAVTLF